MELSEGRRRYLEVEADILTLPPEKQLPRALSRIRYLEMLREQNERPVPRWAPLLEIALGGGLAVLGMWLAIIHSDWGFPLWDVLVSFLAAHQLRKLWV